MKNLLAVLVVFIGWNAQSNESLDVTHPVLESQLKTFDINDPSLVNVESGLVRVHQEESITLILNKRFECSAGAICPQVMPAPIVIELPFVKEEVDSCGSVTYTAALDKSLVDGLRESLVVVDNTRNICLTIVPLPATFVEYTSYYPWSDEEYVSYFTGEKLSFVPIYF